VFLEQRLNLQNDDLKVLDNPTEIGSSFNILLLEDDEMELSLSRPELGDDGLQ
jgi:hypothetical protein